MAEKKPATVSLILEEMGKVANSCYVDLNALPKEAPKISTGSSVVDLLSGIGGFPVGGVVEVAGEFSSGKTTLALSCAAHVQKVEKGTVLFADFEQAFDPYYAQSLGVDVKSVGTGGKFILLQPDTLEEGWDTVQKLVATGEIKLLIVDSVAAGIPKAIIEGQAGEGRIGLQSALLAPEYAKLVSHCKHSGCTALLLNQVRTKFEKRGMTMIVSQDTTGGNALKHYCLMRLWLKIEKKIEDLAAGGDDKEFLGNRVKFQFIKNKCGRPYRTGSLIIRFGQGIDNESALMDMAVENGILEQSGSYFILNDEKKPKWQGREATRNIIKTDKYVRETIEKALRES